MRIINNLYEKGLLIRKVIRRLVPTAPLLPNGYYFMLIDDWRE